MKKANTSINLTISLMVVSALFLGVLLGVIYKSNYNNKVYINPTITVRDSTDIKEINKYSDSDIKYSISKSIQEVVSREFDRTTNYLNFTIVLFAIFLTLILVVFGFFTVRKMTEAKELLDEILATPDAVMKKYYDNQLNELIPNLISSKPAVKSDTIQKLYSNTQLIKEKHYELLSKIMEKEYDSISSYTTMNVINLFDILCRLDYSKTIDLGYNIYDKHFNHRSMDFLIPLLLESPEKKHKEKFLFYLCETSNSIRTNKLIQNIENFDIYDIETLKYIVKNAPQNIVFKVLSTLVQKRKGEVDLIPLIESFNEKLLVYPHFNQIVNLLRQNEQLSNEVIISTLDKIIKNPLKSDEVLNLIKNLNSYILDDEKLIDIILILKDRLEPEIDFKNLFKTIKQEKNPKLVGVIEKIEKDKTK